MGLPLDEVDVEIAPGADLSADSSTWAWVSLCEPEAGYPNGRAQRPVTIEQGRRSESDTAGPSHCTVLVRNEDGALTPSNPLGPWYGQLGKGTPLRVTWTSSTRFFGFITELPTTWLGIVDNSRVLIRADGITRRLDQGADALDSPLFRALSTHPLAVAYWPCEDNDGATSAASPLVGVEPLQLGATVTFGSQVDGLPGSKSSVLIGTGTGAVLGRVPNHTPGDVYVVELAWRQDDVADGNRAILEAQTTSPGLARWRMFVNVTNFVLQAYDSDGNTVINQSEAWHPDLFGRWVRAELRLQDTGTSVQWAAHLFAIDTDQTVLNSLSGIQASSDMGRVVRAGVGGGGFPQERYTAHIAVLTGPDIDLPIFDASSPTTSLPQQRHAAYHGFTGELAADRFERLCDEEGLSCSILAPTGGLFVPGIDDPGNATTPDSAALDITGDLDVRAWVAPQIWEPEFVGHIVSKWEATGNQRSWALAIDSISFAAGTTGFSLLWSTDGTAISSVAGAIPAPPPDGGFLALRATLDVDNGASGHDVNLYVGPSLDGPWTLVHSETGSGTTSIFSGSADLYVGANDVDFDFIGHVRAVRAYDGIDGTLVASPDFTAQDIGTLSFDDDQGNTWTVAGNARIVRADDSMPMGPQQIDTLIANLRDVAVTDGGRLSEHMGGLRYRTRTDLYNQVATEIDFCDLNGAPTVTDDDRSVVNDLTASKPAGSSVRAQDQAHIDRHGRFPASFSANPSSGDQLAQIAYWYLALGTVEDERWPQIPISINSQTQHLLADWLALEPGDRLQIPQDTPQFPGVDVDLIVEGWTEVIWSRRAEAVINCVPASPYTVAVFDSSRFDTAGSETSGSFVAGTDTSLTVVTTATRPWVNSTDHPGEFPFTITVSGVVLNVTAISGATSPQTFTVDVTPTNGVEKTIPAGSAVSPSPRPAFAL